MNDEIVSIEEPVLLVGGAIGDNPLLKGLLAEFNFAVGVDSGADWLMSVGRVPDALIGDLDSVSMATRTAMPTERVHHIEEQDSTDFDKALRSVSGPLIVGIGFLGGQADHLLAVLNTLVRFQDRAVVLVGEKDVIFHLPPAIYLDLEPGTRVSLFPMREVDGMSTGLHWPIEGLEMAPWGQIGTSNHADGPVHINMHGSGMLLILPVSQRRLVQQALASAGGLWPAL